MAPSKKPKVYVNAKSDEVYTTLQPFNATIRSLAFAGSVVLQKNIPAPAEGCATNLVNTSCEVFVDLREIIDIAQEIKRLEAKRDNIIQQRDNLLKKTSEPTYTKVPEKVREANAQKVCFFSFLFYLWFVFIVVLLKIIT